MNQRVGDPLVAALWLRVLLAAVLTIMLAYASPRLVETPVRRWANKRLQPAVVRSVPEATPAGGRDLVSVRQGR